MEANRQEQTAETAEKNLKKPYERPELQKHGNVESLTQIQQLPGGSQPIVFV